MPGGCRKTIQFISWTFFVAAIWGFLFTTALARLSSPQVAKPVLREVFKESLVQSAFAQSFEENQERLKGLPADEPLVVPGFPGIIITAGEAAKFEREELADYISRQVVVALYKGQTLETTDMLGTDILSINPLSAVFSSPAHATTLRFRSIALSLAIFWGALLLIFGRGFGRFFGLGMGMSVGALLPLVVYTMIMNRFDETMDITLIPGVEESIVSAPIISSFKDVAQSSCVESIAVMVIGLLILLGSIVGRMVMGSAGRK